MIENGWAFCAVLHDMREEKQRLMGRRIATLYVGERYPNPR